MGIGSLSPQALTCTVVPGTVIQRGRIGLCLSGNSTNWPATNWQTLAHILHQQGKNLPLFDGEDAKALAHAMSAACPGTDELTGRLAFVESVPHLHSLELLIGNDTDFTHFAAPATRKLMIIKGACTIGRLLPWPESDRTSGIFNGLACYDRGWICEFPNRSCINSIPPAAVLEYATAILTATAPALLELNTQSVECQTD